MVVAAGEAAGVQLRYSPTAPGTDTATLTFTSDATGSPAVAIAVQGTATDGQTPAIDVPREEIVFQEVSVGETRAVAIPVVNDEHEILGEIRVGRLFRYGLPDFFSKLKSVSFIAEFDPFEKYFEDERNTLARDIMETNARTVPLNYTIMEIVFDLAIRTYPKLYVVDENNRWVGTIDKSVVLDNVINY
jgi:CBS domain-containing protein